jgi:ABC-2 type transport system ATP-binding protein
MTPMLEADNLGKVYGSRWALQGCTLSIPPGRVAGLVGPNGAGKTTLLELAVGLRRPSAGTLSVLGASPAAGPEHLARVGFVAQDAPAYANLTVSQHLQMGSAMNPQWDEGAAASRARHLGLDLGQKAGSLSGGQRAQLALTMALAKQPDVLLLDEPVASLDPLARREFLQSLMEVVAEKGTGVILSSHLVSDLERVCDYLVVMAASHVELSGDVADLLGSHHLLYGPLRPASALPANQEVIEQSHTDRQSTFLVRTGVPVLDPVWTVKTVTLEELVLAYMRRGRGPQPPVDRPALELLS